MDVLLKLGIVPFTAVSDTIQSMILSIELTGPTLLTDSSSSLLTTVMRERMKENPTLFNQTAERIMSWMLGKWTPSKFMLTNKNIAAHPFRSMVRANIRRQQCASLQRSRHSADILRRTGHTP